MGPVRRTINFICALALIVVGAYFFVDLLLYTLHPKGIKYLSLPVQRWQHSLGCIS
jgi:hypothetical protein